ncbi:MAG: pseudouridine synthase [Gammaproteobacteria bacterium]|nr:pseudouridine synthase [Gammaproteobacteria bacterium]
MSEQERVQKLLSRLGYGSRREIERWIVEGSVKLNGEVAVLGCKVGATDTLIVKGKKVVIDLSKKLTTQILLYYKPVGEVCSRDDPLFSKTVFMSLPPVKEGRWVQVGRLDVNTAGLLIFTNDGALAHHLMHPKFEIEREYAVRVCGQVTKSMLQNLKEGVMLEDGKGKFKQIQFQGGEGSNAWYHVVLTEGRHREVRRLWQSQGVEVSRLIRIRYGSLQLPRTLSRGKWVELAQPDVKAFMKQVGMPDGQGQR